MAELSGSVLWDTAAGRKFPVVRSIRETTAPDLLRVVRAREQTFGLSVRVEAHDAAMDRAELERLVASGLSVRQLAVHFGVSPTKVRYWLTKYGLRTLAARDRAASARARREGNTRVLLVCRHHGKTEFVREGRGYFRCAKCRADRVARWRRRVKARLVEEAGGCCLLCGYDRYAGALHFHHLDPSQRKFGLAFAGVARSVERLREEAGKCALVCSNCHAEVEAGLATLPPPPGVRTPKSDPG